MARTCERAAGWHARAACLGAAYHAGVFLLLLLAAFIIVPIVEIWAILQVGYAIGAPATVLLLVIDSVVGAWLVKREGRRVWRAFWRALDEGRWPGDEVVQGALFLVGGALLLTPGFVTDIFGLLAVLPPTRAVISRLLRRYLQRRAGSWVYQQERHTRRDRPAGTARRFRRGGSGRREVLDVEVVSVERDAPPPDREGGAERRRGGA